jgi:putative colanic acid biosynthesis acetyltransferase WcaF
MRTDPGSFVNPHGLRNQAGRLLWSLVWATLFRPSPWFMNGWRRFLLRAFGAKIGRSEFKPTVRVWAPWRLSVGNDVYVDRGVFLYNVYGVEIADRVVISFGSVLCTASHDFRRSDFPLIGRPIMIHNDTWIAAECFLTPGVTVGNGAVVGARAFVTKDVAPWSIVSGNPAVVIGMREVKEL